MDEPPAIHKKFRLTEVGYKRFMTALPEWLRDPEGHPLIEGHPLYANISMLKGYPEKKTISKILERQQPVLERSIKRLFSAVGLEILPSDYERFPINAFNAPFHYYVPRELSKHFVGRVQELKSLRRHLAKENVAAISGLGGIGKTQIALAYCDRYKHRYNYVFWLRVASDAEVQQGYAEIARHLKLLGAAASEQERATAATQWLAQRPGWLLILDNLDKVESGTLYFPREPKGHVLITTRLERLNLPDNLIPFPLKTLSPSESLEFLLSRCQRAETTSDERGAAAKLAERLGYLPLAMAQAAAYIETMTTFANYLALYDKRELAQLAKKGSGTEEFPTTVSATWEINFQAIEEEALRTQTAAKYAPYLLQFSAFLAPDDIPLELVRQSAKAFCPELDALFVNAEDEAEAEEVCNEALEPLTRYSLVARKMENHTFSLHPLVQTITRARLSETERSAWKERMVQAVSSAFPPAYFEHWLLCESLLPHATVVAEMIRRDNLKTEAAGHLLNNLGRYLYDRGRYTLVESYYLMALDIWRTVHTEAHPAFATTLNYLGMMHHTHEHFEEAETHYNRALGVRRQHFSNAPLDVAECLNNLAELYSRQGFSDQAETLLLEALEITQQFRPQADRYLATVLQNLGLLCYRQYRDAEAEAYYARAEAVFRACKPPNPLALATCLHNTAQLYRRQSRLDAAKPLYLEALAIQENAHPDGHPETGITHCNLAMLYDDLECDQEAERHFAQAWETDRKALGENHPEVAADKERLDEFRRSRKRRR